MKIQIASDIHIEFDRPKITGGTEFKLDKTDADVIVLAGDIGVGYDDELEFCRRVIQEHQKPVVFVLGNHSFYGKGNIDTIRGQWCNTVEAGLIYLDHSTVTSFTDNGETVVFTGGIFWTDFNKGNEHALRKADECMNDFRQSRMNYRDSTGGRLNYLRDGDRESAR